MSTFSDWVKNSYTVKFAIVGFLMLILLIPTSMIEGLISERQERSNQVNAEVGSKWGNTQTLTGPIINVPYKTKFKSTNANGETIYTDGTGTLHFLPEQLNISNNTKTEIRKRGIYNAVVYSNEATFSGHFSGFDESKLNIEKDAVLWEQAYISLPISDLRGIKNKVIVTLNNQQTEMNPGIKDNDILIHSYNQQYNLSRYKDMVETVPVPSQSGNSGASSGLSAPITIKDVQKTEFSFTLLINGSSALSFIPTGKETNVSVTSPYTTPSFDGAFLPDTRSISDKGFKADWKVLNLNRNFPQEWTNNAYDINNASFGVNLLVPIDHYQKTMRSAKYAIMFILLTFLVFVFAEILNGYKIHPVQYLLIGLALVVFYTLLLSLSEQIGFTKSYLVSSAAIILLITIYAKSIFRENKLMAVLAGILLILYGFLFIILRSEDYALLIGSIGLFIVLTVVMYLSRMVKWYREDT
ncbi:MAG: cell envelope integrity protein CreD [Sphingobacteriales bacterium]|nr:cell envelope integrity protein CreD [Sphingobacteriales bacterium]